MDTPTKISGAMSSGTKRKILFIIVLIIFIVLWFYVSMKVSTVPTLTPEQEKSAILEGVNSGSSTASDADKATILKQTAGTGSTNTLSSKDKEAILNAVEGQSATQ
jgi:hypothetical protein